MMTRRAWATASILGGFSALVARADVSPAVYDEWRIKAEEAILVEVESVETKPLKSGELDVTLSAKVVAVERSKAGLKKGARITLRYENGDEMKNPPLGAGWPPILKKGDVVPAFLNKARDKEEFTPAATSMSFAMTPAS